MAGHDETTVKGTSGKGAAKIRASGKPPAQGWIGTAKFGKGGIRAQGNSPSTLTIHALNPERGTDWSVAGRLDLLGRALRTVPPEQGETLYLTSAGWFGCGTPKGRTVNGLTWLRLPNAEAEDLKKNLGRIAEELPLSAHLAVGVDRNCGYAEQELWWFQGGHRDVQHTQVRTDEPESRSIGDFRVLAFICGAIWGNGGSALNAARDLPGVDVVLDAGHASLNRQSNQLVSLNQKRWAFQRTICSIRTQCGAVFSQAHEDNYAYVRNCDDWIVYRTERPFPRGARRGMRIQP